MAQTLSSKMLSKVGFSRACNSTSLITSTNFSLSSAKPHFSYVLIASSFQSITQTPFNFYALLKLNRDGFRVSAIEKRRKGGIGLSEVEDFDYDNEEEEVDEEDEDEIILPFGKMKKWLDNKPKGFGEGKEYDTSIEEKLFEDIEQSRRAQAANINKLKNSTLNPVSSKYVEKPKATATVPSGYCVRVVNLPKKKKVHRDLKLAFNGVSGLLNIIPAVSGSKKTRDPICKGFAFVDFKTKQEATRFVQTFSKQYIMFGKIQKQIKCEMMDSQSQNSEEQSKDDTTLPRLTIPVLVQETDATANSADTSSDLSKEEFASYEFDELNDERLEDVRENLESVSMTELTGVARMNQRMESVANSFPPSNPTTKTPKIQKNNPAKGKAQKGPKLHVPGSAKRLRIKEKAVLTDVFSKYGAKYVVATKEKS